MSTVEPAALLEQLHWRYAVKKFDPARQVPPADWAALERATTLAPSSFGLQPWRFIVVTSTDVKRQLMAASHGQSQVGDCSHLVVFAVRNGVDAAYVDRFIGRVSDVRHVPPAALAGYRNVMVGAIGSKTPEQVDAWSGRQVYIALGFLLASAALLGVDACPMEGIVGAQYDQILGLGNDGYATLAVAAVGYRSADDHAAAYPKVRFADGDVVQHVD